MYNTQHQTLKILIARKKGISNEDITSVLGRSDLEVLMTSSGNDAIGLMKAHPDIRMAVLNADLEGLNGFDTTMLAKSLNQNIPIILLVNYGTRETINLAAMVGCDQVLQNPVEPAIFEILLDKYIGNAHHDEI
jgi:CheY-like chemotaxis protein